MTKSIPASIITLLWVIVFCLPSRAISQQSTWATAPNIEETYDPGSEADYPHHYVHKTVLCNATGNNACNVEDVFRLMLSDARFIAPAYDSGLVTEGSVHLLMIKMPGFEIPGLHPIKVRISEKNHFVINYTLPGHVLHPGMVQRQIVLDGSNVALITTGTGYSKPQQFLSPDHAQCFDNFSGPLKFVSAGLKKIQNTVAEYLQAGNSVGCVIASVWDPVDQRLTNAILNSTFLGRNGFRNETINLLCSNRWRVMSVKGQGQQNFDRLSAQGASSSIKFSATGEFSAFTNGNFIGTVRYSLSDDGKTILITDPASKKTTEMKILSISATSLVTQSPAYQNDVVTYSSEND